MEIKLNGKCYSLRQQIEHQVDDGIFSFLKEWYSDSLYVVGHTSGSTGIPKEIHLLKEDMRSSARITNEFLGITPDSVLLLCLSVSYIAGKMMIVRAIESGAELITIPVSSHPLKAFDRRVDLAAMVPMQVEESLKIPEEKMALAKIDKLLIGGAPVSPALEKQLQEIATCCYATYGMTETVSHVALRQLNRDGAYSALGQVSFSSDDRGCLIIDAPHLQSRRFVTNDMVRLIDEKHFEWLGRYDNVINSGGIKFHPEVIEDKIAGMIPRRFFITSRPDNLLGQRMVLAIEGEQPGKAELDDLHNKLSKLLTSYEMPREILFSPRFNETTSGKVIRHLEGLRIHPLC